jgi:hypothetical protein
MPPLYTQPGATENICERWGIDRYDSAHLHLYLVGFPIAEQGDLRAR